MKTVEIVHFAALFPKKDPGLFLKARYTVMEKMAARKIHHNTITNNFPTRLLKKHFVLKRRHNILHC